MGKEFTSLELSGVTTEDPADLRLAEMMLFVASRSEDDKKFGATKLNKILFFADFVSMRRRGFPIVGSAFQRLPQGPAPKRLLPVRDQLIATKRAVMRSVKLASGFTQQRLTALDEPVLNHFSAEDIAIVTEIMNLLSDHSAEEVSELSHTIPAWELAEDKEEIPFFAAFISSIRPTSASQLMVQEHQKAA